MGTNRVILMGGLGNQLFQYSFAKRLNLETGSAVILDPNYLAIRRDRDGRPDIAKFELDGQISIGASQKEPRLIQRLMGLTLRKHLEQQSKLDKLICVTLRINLSLLLSARYKSPTRAIVCTDNGYVPVGFQVQNAMYLGYFQSYKYDSVPSRMSGDNLSRLNSSFERFNYFEELANIEKPLVVHIRLTDYRNEPNFGIPSRDYYNKSIEYHFSQYNYGCIWLFSDEPDNALTYIPESFRHLVRNVSNEIVDPVDTFEVMRLAKGYVIANSSYSWWAARSSHNQSSLVTYPEPWFERMPTPEALCPPNWHPFSR